MAAICGKAGKVLIGTDVVANVEDWNLDIAGMELSDITGLGATVKAFLATGLPGPATGTINLVALDNADTATAALRAAILAGTAVTLKLYESATKYWTGTDAYLTNTNQAVNVTSAVSGSYSFQYLTLPTYT
jgi:hypothetical protein